LNPRWVRLFPRTWRAEYGDGLAALLEETPASPAAAADVVRAAVVAHGWARPVACTWVAAVLAATGVEVLALRAGISANIVWAPTTIERAAYLVAFLAPLVAGFAFTVERSRRHRSGAIASDRIMSPLIVSRPDAAGTAGSDRPGAVSARGAAPIPANPDPIRSPAMVSGSSSPRAASPGTGPAVLSRRAMGAFGGLFLVGVVYGLVQLLTDQDKTSSGASVAVANAIHVVLLLVVAFLTVLFGRRRPAAARAFWLAPFTELGWRRLVDAWLCLPLAVAELGLVLIGQLRLVARIECQRIRRMSVGAAPVGDGSTFSLAGALDVAISGLVSGVVLLLAAYAVGWAPLRVGQQVFAALDPDFTHGAWGGPSYLGTLLAHCFDAVLFLQLGTALIARLSMGRARQSARALASVAVQP
jgi:tryptophan-rich sensory protein